jgi:hypothetical protein
MLVHSLSFVEQIHKEKFLECWKKMSKPVTPFFGRGDDGFFH